MEDIDGIKFIQSNDRLEEAESFQFVIYSVRFVQFCKIRFEKNLNPSNIEIIKEQKIHSFYRTLDLASVPLALSDQTTQQLFIWINSRNEIIEFDSLNEGPKSKIYGPRKCILYAAKFLSITSEYSIVASGTVFKEIIIWSLEFESLKVTELQVLQGHDGIIFDLQYNAQFNLLISVSDDRSLRIWSDHRIGFCPQSFRDWASNRFESKQIYYGHEARITRTQIVIYNNFPLVVSIGEDSYIIAWSLVEPFRMLKRKKFFRNNRFWSITMGSDYLVAGGSDGSIHFLLIEEFLELNSYRSIRYQNDGISFIKSICLLDSALFKMITYDNRGMFHYVDRENSYKILRFENFDFEKNFNDYIRMALNQNRNRIVIGSKYGHLGLIRIESNTINLLAIEKISSSKIFDLSFVDENQLIYSTVNGRIKILNIKDDRLIESKNEYLLPNSRHRWTSCGLIHQNLLIVGDQSGNVFGYYLHSSNPSFRFRNIHGTNSVTIIKKHPKTCKIYSSGRNGKIMEYYCRMDQTRNFVEDFFHLRTFTLFSSMDWIAGFQFSLDSIHLAWGFESRYFQIWNVTENIKLFDEDCGGGHRCWDIRLETNPKEPITQIEFVYYQQNSLIRLLNRKNFEINNPSVFHNFPSIPRKINCCQLIFETDDSFFIMIAGEDTVIQILQYHRKFARFDVKQFLYGHISNVTSIRCWNDPTSQCVYVASVGGRSQLIIWRISSDPDDHNQLITQEKNINFNGYYNNQTDFEVAIRRSINNPSNIDRDSIDVRYLDVDINKVTMDGEKLQLRIIVACSDRTIRIFDYFEEIHSSSKSQLVLRIVLEAAQTCINRIRIISRIDVSKLVDDLGVHSSNDGLIHFWSIDNDYDETIDHQSSNPQRLKSIQSFRIHQTGINAIDLQINDRG